MRHIITIFLLLTLTVYAEGHTTKGITKVRMLNSNEWYAVGYNGLFIKTTNAGVDWTARYLENGSYNLWDCCFFNSTTGIVAGASSVPESYLARTTNGGLTWVRIDAPALLGVSPMTFANERIGYLYGCSQFFNSSIFKTTNGGLNWFKTNLYQLPFDVKSIFTIDTNHVYAALTNGYILYTSNGGASWAYLDTGMNDDVIDVCFVNQNTGVFCSGSPFNMRGKESSGTKDKNWYLNFGATTNKGISWNARWIPETENNAVKYFGNSFYVIGDYNRILKTGDFGSHWDQYYYDIPITASPFTMDIKGNTFLVGGFGNNNSLLIKSTNSGVNWTSMAIPPPTFTISGIVRYIDNGLIINTGTVKAFKLDKNSGNIIVFDSTEIQTNGTYVLEHIPQDTVDIGVYPNSTPIRDYPVTYYPATQYWQQTIILMPTGNLTNINIYVRRMTNFIANNSVSGKVMRFSLSPVSNLKDAVLYAKKDTNYVGCAISDGNGVYHIQSLPTGNIKIVVDRLGYKGDSTTVNLTSTSNIDSVNFYLNRLIIGIKQIDARVPSSCALYQNYPNPFNPATKIKFDIPKSSPLQGNGSGSYHTTLRVYDIMGKEVATLVNEKLSPGTYEVTFNGSKLTSGVYFYKITAGEYSGIRKMLIIK
jgi:photosystem II stability/assembly factor-like uncharacterized protein